MSDDEAPLSPLEAMEREKARLLAEAAAKQAAAAAVQRDIEEWQRLAAFAARHNLVVTPAAEIAAPANFDGTVRSLAHQYRTHPNSPYRKLRHATRKTYDRLIETIIEAA